MMFGIGFSEMVLIALVLIVFIRPEDWPAILRKAGKAYGKIKRTIDELMEFKNAFMKQVEEAAKLEETKAEAPKLEPPKTAEAQAPAASAPSGEAAAPSAARPEDAEPPPKVD